MRIFNRRSNSSQTLFQKFNRSILVPAFITLSLITAVFAIAGYIRLDTLPQAKAENKTSASLEPESVSPPPPQSSAEIITVTPRGFEPSQISRPAGRPVMLVVNNKSGSSELKLRLQRENGATLGRGQLPRGRRQWRMFVNLPAGRYRVVDENRPGVGCDIEITP